MLHLIFIPIYSLFKTIANRPAFDSPENYAAGFLSLLCGLSVNLIYHFNNITYSKKTGGTIFVVTTIIVYVGLYLYYIRGDYYLKVYKKYKNTIFIGALLDIGWTSYVLYNAYKIYW
jgi:hypothetical protein